MAKAQRPARTPEIRPAYDPIERGPTHWDDDTVGDSDVMSEIRSPLGVKIVVVLLYTSAISKTSIKSFRRDNNNDNEIP